MPWTTQTVLLVWGDPENAIPTTLNVNLNSRHNNNNMFPHSVFSLFQPLEDMSTKDAYWGGEVTNVFGLKENLMTRPHNERMKNEKLIRRRKDT